MSEYQELLAKSKEIGYIESILESIVYVSGLPTVRPREVVITENGQKGIVQSLKPNLVEVLMLDTKNLRNGLALTRTNQSFEIPVSQEILGRIVDPFGFPIDGGGPIGGGKTLRSIDPGAPGISQRAKINRPFETGVQVVDLLIPLGHGQRELVIGDKKTGKSIFLLQTIANQVSKGTICVYVSIGKRQSDVKAIEDYLRRKKVMDKCVLVAVGASQPASLIYLAPFSGLAIAEYFRDLGQDSLIVFDDLTNHAKFYRELSLLEKKTPGRSSYPGDIFNLHASMLERAGNIKYANKTVSITAMPVAESFEGDITGYIQTNLMSITDGHIFFDIEEFRNGARPAINHALSVSRVGNQTRNALIKELAQKIREALTKYEKDKEIARFGVELPQETRDQIDLGEKIKLILNQDTETLITQDFSLILFGLLLGGFWKTKNLSQTKVEIIKLNRQYELGYMQDLLKQIAKMSKIEELVEAVRSFYSKVNKVLYE